MSITENHIKAMTCRQLGRACDEAFHANSFDEMAEMSGQHAVKMFQKKYAAHLRVMNQTQKPMKNPEAMKQWFESKNQEFESSFEG